MTLPLKKILAVIPARGGSKGLRNKNIKNLNGKPLIAWTIEEAKKSKYISELIVSSEDEKIIDVAKKYGASIPFVRPEHLALDSTPGIDPIKHAIDYYLKKDVSFDYVICLQCTSPLRRYEDIDKAIEICVNTKSSGIVSLCEVEHSPYWMKMVNSDGTITEFIRSEYNSSRRQDLPKVYRPNGAIFMAKPELIMTTNSWYAADTKAFIMDNEDSIDIDSELDFHLAEIILQRRNA